MFLQSVRFASVPNPCCADRPAKSFLFSGFSGPLPVRLYDGTVAADYYRAIGQIEAQLALAETTPPQDNPAHLLALVDSLQAGTLNENQKEVVQTLRKVILNLATK